MYAEGLVKIRGRSRMRTRKITQCVRGRSSETRGFAPLCVKITPAKSVRGRSLGRDSEFSARTRTRKVTYSPFLGSLQGFLQSGWPDYVRGRSHPSPYSCFVAWTPEFPWLPYAEGHINGLERGLPGQPRYGSVRGRSPTVRGNFIESLIEYPRQGPAGEHVFWSGRPVAIVLTTYLPRHLLSERRFLPPARES